jgi:hypothetical protein
MVISTLPKWLQVSSTDYRPPYVNYKDQAVARVHDKEQGSSCGFIIHNSIEHRVQAISDNKRDVTPKAVLFMGLYVLLCV